MNFFTPIPRLIRRVVIDGQNKYFLQTITYCDQFNYLVDLNYSTSEEVDVNGNFEVNINIIEDYNLPSNNCILPLVHQIELGSLSNSEVIITIHLTTESNQNSESTKKRKGAITISTVGAEEESRPIEPGEF